MKRHLAIPFFAAALLLAIAASPSRADLSHAWNSASEPAAAVKPAPADSPDSSDSSDSSENTEVPAASLDDQIAGLLDGDSLSSSSSPSLDLSAVTVALSEEELRLDRLATATAAEVTAAVEAPSSPAISAPVVRPMER